MLIPIYLCRSPNLLTFPGPDLIAFHMHSTVPYIYWSGWRSSKQQAAAPSSSGRPLGKHQIPDAIK